MQENKKASKTEIVIVLSLLFVLIIGVAAYFLFAPSAGTAVITISTPSAQLSDQNGTLVATATSNNPSMRISLSKNGTYVLTGTRLEKVTLEIRDNSIHFLNSLCPDRLCEGFGWLKLNSQFATCLPAGVNVTVEE